MALSPLRDAEPTAPRASAVDELLGLYADERRLYGEILVLSRRQGDLLRTGAALPELRALLAAKRDRLDAIARLERAQAPARARWETERATGRGVASARLHAALREVATLIEEILVLEEHNDRLLLAESGVGA
jgi:hypothetical protein